MSGVSTLGQALDQINRINDQQSLFSTLSTQLATGKKTQTFGGLGTDVLVSQRARADFTSLDTYINNITNADRRISLTLTVIEEFKAQAENFNAVLLGLSQESTQTAGEIVYWDDPTTPDVVEEIPVGVDTAEMSVDFEALQDFAGNVFDVFVNLLNEQDGDRYILGGAETLTQPININGTLDSAVNTSISNWQAGTLSTADLIADLQDRTTAGNTGAYTDSLIGYSAPLSNGTAGNVFVRADDTIDVEYTALANADPFRDILVAAAVLMNENLPPIADEVQIDANTGLPVIITEGAPGATTDEMKENFFQVFNDLNTMVNNAVDDIDKMRFALEADRARIAGLKENHQNAQNILLGTISGVEDVDINEVAVKINTLQIQLEASFRVTSMVQELSLVRFI